ncbi:prolyl oligopeptidase family serine peptidase [Tenacibaculum aquimarinum]|uniref:prolyl oligopeptidase family serine peptidase n=1 Tax=Tenacibaculum aquimarinum TaxID=2910675 RepID=UPI001F0AFAFB|nr:prolyl oligopeptidase family serine peptidase [Tenacibaculum aquimarinum]MCH3883477.1 prolyl oligopeptidase family serine peptidase [Tenacibaculum aquimarinum]
MAPKKLEIDTYFGQNIQDSYKYMENVEDTILTKWIEDKNKEEKEIIGSINNRTNLLNQINKNSTVSPISISKIKVSDSNFYFYLKNEKFNESPKLFYRKSLNGKEELLYDPKEFKKESKKAYKINYTKPSWDASKILISLTESDKEISEMIIIDVESKKVFPEIIDHCWPSEFGGVKWLPDNSGFTYLHFPVIERKSKKFLLNSATVFYKIGEDPKKLHTLFSKKKNPLLNIKEEDFCEAQIKDSNSKYIFAEVSGATQYTDGYYSEIKNIQSKKVDWKPLFSKNDLVTKFFVKGDSLIYMTSKNSPNFKICKTSIFKPNFKNPTILVSEDSNSKITDFTLTKKGLFFVKTKNGVQANLFKLIDNENIQKVKLPKASGYINVFSKGSEFADLWVSIKGWINNSERFKYNFEEEKFEREKLNNSLNENNTFEDVVIEEIEIPSHDGVMVPLSIIYKKGIKKNNKNRLLINAYGSYGWSNTPYPYSYLLQWIEKGGVYAVAHVRGGGEKGEKWRLEGYRTKKPNTWKDLIACTEYLINNKYTSSERTVAWGASGGGICIGRAITERPNLYAAAIIKVGLLNTLRAETGVGGLNNSKEFGTVKDSSEFKALFEMDSYHSIKDNTNYPSVYLTAGLNDARLSVWHTTKFAARLENATSSKNPVLVSINSDKGHGLNLSQSEINEETADIISFALWQTGHPDYQLK